MTSRKPADPKQKVLETNITYIRKLLDDATYSTLKAQIAISAGSANEAIGWLIDVKPLLQNALALYEATLFTHKQA